MKIYTVHVNPKHPMPLETSIFVQEGFSWLATLFHMFWMLYHRIWWAAAGILAFNFATAYLEEVRLISTEISTVLDSALLVLVGFHANDWYRDALKRQGYVLMDIVSGRNKEEAEQRFLDVVTHQPSALNSEHVPA